MAMEFFKFKAGKMETKYVSLLRSGQIYFSPLFMRENEFLANYYCLLGYDRDKKQIGIKLSKDKVWGSLKLTINKNYKNGLINCRGFFHFFNIAFTKSLHIENFEIQNDMIIINLEEKS